MMRRAALLMIWIELVACDQTQNIPNTKGWHLAPAHGAYEGQLSYNFGDAEKTTFVAECNGDPWFMLVGGDYSAEANDFTVTADNHSWTLRVSRGEHGRGLFVDQIDPATAISAAKRRIEFAVGDWKRKLKPSPELTKFIRSCKEQR